MATRIALLNTLVDLLAKTSARRTTVQYGIAHFPHTLEPNHLEVL